MITLKDFMETVDYRVTEGSNYMWQCYGPNAYRLDSWDGNQDGHSVSIVFDTQTQEVYESSVYDYKNERAYRIINPEYKDRHDDEALSRDVNLKEAWDNVEYVDLDVEEDFLEKAEAIVNDVEYDTRVKVPVNFTDEELLTYMKMAHERDMTFNEFVEEALRYAIEDAKIQQELDDIRPEYDFSDGEQGPYEEAVEKIKKKKKGKK